MPKEGYHPCVGWLELVLGVLLALGVLDGGHPKKRIMLGGGMCLIGKLEPMR